MSQTIKLYHGTSVVNADRIMAGGFKDRVEGGNKNWDGKVLSQAGFVYLTRAYPFFYGMAASKENDEMASVIKVQVRIDDLYPDEDVIRLGIGREKDIDIRDYKQYAELSLEKLGNVAIQPDKIVKILGRKDFSLGEMIRYSDPSMTPLNYRILGQYYRDLTDRWWSGDDYSKVEYFKGFNAIKREMKTKKLLSS
jgi:hypothetical protein